MIGIKDDYKNFIEVKQYDNWWDFTNQFANKEINSKYIFRGHSNYVQINGKNKSSKIGSSIDWTIESTFHRNFGNTLIDDLNYPYTSLQKNIHIYKNHLDLYFKGYKNNNIIEKDVNIEDLKILDILSLMQHLGSPTPLIDFTKNPFTALYFAFAGLVSGGVKDVIPSKENTSYVSIIQLNIEVLKTVFGAKDLNNGNFSFEELESGCIYFYLNPNYDINPNLKLQEGCFILINDFEYFQLEETLNIKLGPNPEYLNFDLTEKPIIKHLIPYKSLDFYTYKCSIYNPFAFLLLKKKLATYLIHDISAIQSDLKNHAINLNCIANPENCECIKKLKANKDILL